MEKESPICEQFPTNCLFSKGFVAKPMIKDDGTINLMKWQCKIPGPKGSAWEQGIYKLFMIFPQDYPLRPPKCSCFPNLIMV